MKNLVRMKKAELIEEIASQQETNRIFKEQRDHEMTLNAPLKNKIAKLEDDLKMAEQEAKNATKHADQTVTKYKELEKRYDNLSVAFDDMREIARAFTRVIT